MQWIVKTHVLVSNKSPLPPSYLYGPILYLYSYGPTHFLFRPTPAKRYLIVSYVYIIQIQVEITNADFFSKGKKGRKIYLSITI